MCLTVNKVFKTSEEAVTFMENPLVTKNEMIVYKVLEHGKTGLADSTNPARIFSPFLYTPYEYGELKTTKEFTYRLKCGLKCGIVFYKMEVEAGLHAYTDINIAQKQAYDFYNLFVETCTVPKGTPYFLSNDGEIVCLALQMPEDPSSLIKRISAFLNKFK